MLQERVKSIPEGKVNREARIEAPKATTYIVPAGEVNRPKSEAKLPQREIKSRGVVVKPEKEPEQPAARPERVAPAKPVRRRNPDSPQDQSERARQNRLRLHNLLHRLLHSQSA